MKRAIIFFVIISAFVAFAAEQLTGRDVLEKVLKRYRGDDSILTIIVTKAKMDNLADKKSFEITTYRLSRPEIIKALVAIRKTGDQHSQPILFLVWDWQDKKREDQLWYYLPSLGKYSKLSAEQGEKQTEAFGFSIEEMKGRDLENADHTLGGLVDYEGEKCYKVVSVPKQPKVEGFAKATSYFRPDSWTAAYVEYTGLDGAPMKKFRVSKVQKIDGVWTEMEGKHEDFKKKSVVTFVVKNAEYNRRISADLFSFSAPPKQLVEGK